MKKRKVIITISLLLLILGSAIISGKFDCKAYAGSGQIVFDFEGNSTNPNSKTVTQQKSGYTINLTCVSSTLVVDTVDNNGFTGAGPFTGNDKVANVSIADQQESNITISVPGGYLFDLDYMDVIESYGDAFTMTMTTSGGQSITQHFNSGEYHNIDTSLNSNFKNISSVTITGDSGFHIAVDNIKLNNIHLPAPTATSSTVSSSPTSIAADGTTTSTITVTLKGDDGTTYSGKTVTLSQGSGSSTITTVSGTTNGSGQATFTVKNTKAETVTYTATDSTDGVTVTQTAAVIYTAGIPTAGNSAVSASPASVAADGTTTSTITVTLKDSNNNPVSGKAVSLAAGSGSSTITTVSGTTDASGQATFTVKNTVLESVTYTATDTTDGVTVTQTAAVSFTAGTPTAGNSTVSASTGTIAADGTATSTITVTLKDANNNVVSGKTVSLSQGSGSSTITTVSGTTNGSGQATFTVKNTKAETVTYTAMDSTDSVTVTQTAAVTYTAGTPTAGNSTVSASPASVAADGTTTSTITVTLKDSNNNTVSGKTVSLAAGSGSSTITTVSGTTNASGQATFTVKNTVLESVTYTATDTTDSVTVTQTAAVSFTAGIPTAGNSTVSVSTGTIAADGTATSTITVTLKDANNNVVSGKTVTLSQGSGSSTITTVSGTTNGSGQATFTVKSTKAETVTYTATDSTDSVTVTQTAAVTYTAGTPTAGNSTVSASPASVAADGTATSTITVTLKDTNNNVVSGKTVTLAAGSGSSTITTVSGTTNASGQATFTVKNTTLESVTYTATDITDGVTVTQTAAVDFTAYTPTYTVVYNGNGNTGGLVPTDNGTYASGASVTVLGNTGSLVKPGYTFIGWNTNAAGSGTSYSASGTFNMGTSNVTLYARWASASSLSLDTASLANGTVSTAYNFSLIASGGDRPYTFSLSSGSLPPGILLASDGTLSGIPNVSGSYSFTILLVDELSHSTSKAYTLVIYAASSSKNDKDKGDTTTSTGGTASTNTPASQQPSNQPAPANTQTPVQSSGQLPTIVTNVQDNTGVSVTAPVTTDVLVKPTLTSTATAVSSLPSTPIFVDTYINTSKQIDLATGSTTVVDNKSISQVIIDPAKLEQRLASSGTGSVIIVPVNVKSDVISSQLDGQMVQNMFKQQAVLNIQTPQASYTIPSTQLNMSTISKQLGQNVSPEDVKINITITKPSLDVVARAQTGATKYNAVAVVPPVQFDVTCTAGNNSVNVENFTVYVERTIEIPEGVDPTKITTAVILNADGTETHIPTHVTIADGKYYAQINSLTNSTYLLVWHPVNPKDSQKSWAKKYINDAASRMILDPIKKDVFSPDTNISRAEFIQALMKGLGLERTGDSTNVFKDVLPNSKYMSSIASAVQRGIISPSKDGKFNPAGTLTKEEAMVFMSNALKVAGLNTNITDKEAIGIVNGYNDGVKVDKTLVNAVGLCIREGVTDIYTNKTIMPKLKLTRAQSAVMIIKLLAKAKLI